MLERLVVGHPPPQAAARISELEACVEDFERVLRQRDEALAAQTAEAARLAGALTIAQRDIDRLVGELGAAEKERQRLDSLLETARPRWFRGRWSWRRARPGAANGSG
jgi:hypothetical protein